MNMPLVLLNRRRRGFTAFSPSTLFSSTAIGIWLDPSDLSTMFSDRAGTTPVTAPGTVVGLRLDKSKGLVLGAELVTNGGFATDTDWVKGAGWTISGGVATGATATASLYSTNSISAVSGKTYMVTFTVTAFTSGSVRPNLGANVNGSVRVATGTYTEYLTPTGGDGRIYFVVSSFVGSIDNISVRELPGNHATAPTDAARPIYGIEPKGGRRNLLTQTEAFDGADWVKTNGGVGVVPVVTANAGTDPIGGSTADRVQFSLSGGTTSSDISQLRQTAQTDSVSTYTFSFWAKSFDGSSSYQMIAFGSASAAQTVAVTGAWTKFTFTSFGPNINYSLTLRGGQTPVNSNAVDILIWGAQLELGSTATAYQKVTTAYDVTESGVQTCHYCRYDGSDDSMSTAAIDFTATDKMSVFAGVRKLSDATMGAAICFSANPPGTVGAFEILGPAGAGASDYRWTVRGTSTSTMNPSGFAAPVSNVLTGTADISGDLATLRANGSVAATSASDLGTGNFGNHPIFIGRRNNATLPFNGKDYGIIIVGKAASAGEITDTETWLAAKTSGVSI